MSWKHYERINLYT